MDHSPDFLPLTWACLHSASTGIFEL